MGDMTKKQLDNKLSTLNLDLALGWEMKHGYLSGSVALELHRFGKLDRVLETGSCWRCYTVAIEHHSSVLKNTIINLKMDIEALKNP